MLDISEKLRRFILMGTRFNRFHGSLRLLTVKYNNLGQLANVLCGVKQITCNAFRIYPTCVYEDIIKTGCSQM